MNLDDLELLMLEIGTIWPLDDNGSLTGEHLVVIAESTHNRDAVVNARVPEPLAFQLRDTAADQNADIGEVIARCSRLLDGSFGELEVSSGPSYLVRSVPEPAVGHFRYREAGVFLVRQKSADEDLARSAERPANWEPDEWADLLAGKLGPWAMALDDGRITSICHCARLTEIATEAGVWTHPEFRGKGRAAAVTAAWASLMLCSPSSVTGRHVFYSTSSDNQSSQRVAARLGLRRIGNLWKLTPPRTA